MAFLPREIIFDIDVLARRYSLLNRDSKPIIKIRSDGAAVAARQSYLSDARRLAPHTRRRARGRLPEAAETNTSMLV